MFLVQDLHTSSVLLKLISRKHIRRLQTLLFLDLGRALLSQRDDSYVHSSLLVETARQLTTLVWTFHTLFFHRHHSRVAALCYLGHRINASETF